MSLDGALPMFAQIVFPTVSSYYDKPFTYKVPPELKSSAAIGMQVKVPFGKRTAIGYIVSLSDKPPDIPAGIKEIKEIRGDSPFFSRESAKAAMWLSKYYVSFLGSALRTVLPPGASGFERPNGRKRLSLGVSPRKVPKPSEEYVPTGLTREILKSGELGMLLLGHDADHALKIYMDLARHMVSQGKGIVVLYPDAEYLLPAAKVFKDEFGVLVGVLHSAMPSIERFLEWRRIYSGEATIVLGTRAAVFAPVSRLGLIVVDREEGYGYKQETSPKYNAGTAALFRGRSEGLPVVLSSRCPLPETYHKADSGELKLIHACNSEPKRGPIEVVDMNTEKRAPGGIFSMKLLSKIEDVLEARGKVLLIAGRRGHSTWLNCADCGTTMKCPGCSAVLVYSMDQNRVICARCGFSSGTSMVCPNCLGSRIRYSGTGAQKVDAEIKRLFATAGTLRIDRDSVSKGSIRPAVEKAFEKDGVSVLIGTHLAAKAADFIRFDLAAVLSADMHLAGGSFRSAEETFRLLYLLSADNVMVQTLNPDHYAVRLAAERDLKGFYERELAQRRSSGDPPFGGLIKIAFSGTGGRAEEQASLAVTRLQKRSGVRVLGPVPDAQEDQSGQARWQILIKGTDLDIIKEEISGIIRSLKDRRVGISVDVDPVE